jgi:CubicO group peptidase (beta-lactamase class C family)
MLSSLALGPLLAAPAGAQEVGLPDEEALAALLIQRIDVERQSLGIALGVVGAGGERFVGHGAVSTGDPRTPSADTVFNVGSIAKVFTGIALMDAVQRGEVALDDPVALHLPAGTTLPTYDGQAITLVDLATHTAGLPTNPDDFPPETDLVGQAGYTREQLFAFLGRHQPVTPPGSAWLYSNLDMVLIREALCFRTGLDYPTLLAERVLAPLGLVDTAVSYDALDEAQKLRVAPGHDLRMRELPPEPASILMGAGGLHSTARDLMRLLSAFQGLLDTPLAPALRAMLDVRRSMRPALEGDQAIALQIFGEGESAQIAHAGSTPGYAASIAWTPGRFVVVTLSNAAPPVLDMSAHILDPRVPLNEPLRPAAAAGVDADRLLGRYVSDDGMVFEVARDGDVLTFEAIGGAPKVEIEPESETVYLVPRLGVRLTFGGEPPAQADSISFDFGGVLYVGRRVSE